MGSALSMSVEPLGRREAAPLTLHAKYGRSQIALLVEELRRVSRDAGPALSLEQFTEAALKVSFAPARYARFFFSLFANAKRQIAYRDVAVYGALVHQGDAALRVCARIFDPKDEGLTQKDITEAFGFAALALKRCEFVLPGLYAPGHNSSSSASGSDSSCGSKVDVPVFTLSKKEQSKLKALATEFFARGIAVLETETVSQKALVKMDAGDDVAAVLQYFERITEAIPDTIAHPAGSFTSDSSTDVLASNDPDAATAASSSSARSNASSAAPAPAALGPPASAKPAKGSKKSEKAKKAKKATKNKEAQPAVLREVFLAPMDSGDDLMESIRRGRPVKVHNANGDTELIATNGSMRSLVALDADVSDGGYIDMDTGSALPLSAFGSSSRRAREAEGARRSTVLLRASQRASQREREPRMEFSVRDRRTGRIVGRAVEEVDGVDPMRESSRRRGNRSRRGRSSSGSASGGGGSSGSGSRAPAPVLEAAAELLRSVARSSGGGGGGGGGSGRSKRRRGGRSSRKSGGSRKKTSSGSRKKTSEGGRVHSNTSRKYDARRSTSRKSSSRRRR